MAKVMEMEKNGFAERKSNERTESGDGDVTKQGEIGRKKNGGNDKGR
jgi:hypothetical protein